MPQVDFFAAPEDQLELLRFLFATTDLRVLEHTSRPDAELREFRSAEEADAAFALGHDPHGNGLAAMLALWSPGVMPELRVRRINFDPGRVRHARYRYDPRGGGLMQLYFGGVRERALTRSHFGHFSEARARALGMERGVDWQRLAQLSRKVRYHIGRRMAVARVPGRPILPAAAALWRDGYVLKESARAPHHWEAAGLLPDA